jgi:hypothetical protein
MRFWIAMAINAPSHGQIFGLVNDFHFVNSAVASDAAYTAIHVNSMVEKHEVR